MTTSKRLPLFLKTVESLENVRFQEYIDRCIIIDDHSSPEDCEAMVQRMKQANVEALIIHNQDESVHRHVVSMNIWLEAVIDHPFVFHCEDDWEFFESKPNMFYWAAELLYQHEWIGQACFTVVPIRTTRSLHLERFWIRTIANSPQYPGWRENPPHWPSRFTLNPGITRVASLTEKFQLAPNFERAYGQQWVEAGWTTIYHPTGYCRHIGGSQSAYEINGSVH